MGIYTIDYTMETDQHEADADLINAIKDQGRWWRSDTSTWVVISERSAAQIRDSLASHLRGNDRLFVVREDREVAWAGFGETRIASQDDTEFHGNRIRMSQPL